MNSNYNLRNSKKPTDNMKEKSKTPEKESNRRSSRNKNYDSSHKYSSSKEKREKKTSKELDLEMNKLKINPYNNLKNGKNSLNLDKDHIMKIETDMTKKKRVREARDKNTSSKEKHKDLVDIQQKKNDEKNTQNKNRRNKKSSLNSKSKEKKSSKNVPVISAILPNNLDLNQEINKITQNLNNLNSFNNLNTILQNSSNIQNDLSNLLTNNNFYNLKNLSNCGNLGDLNNGQTSFDINQMNAFINNNLRDNYCINNFLNNNPNYDAFGIFDSQNQNFQNEKKEDKMNENQIFIKDKNIIINKNENKIRMTIPKENNVEITVSESIKPEEIQKHLNENIEEEKKILLKDELFWKKIKFSTELMQQENPLISMKLERNVTADSTKEQRPREIKADDFNFGNFEHFYYNKFLSAFNDERMKYFEEEMIKNKRCLDIGCNTGMLTILIAVNFQPKMIEGIDIDSKLIKKAIKNYKYVLRNNLNKEYIDNLIISGKKNEMSNNIVEEILNKTEFKQKKNEGNQIDKSIQYNDVPHVYCRNMEEIIKEKIVSEQQNRSNKMSEILEKLKKLPQSFLINLGMNNRQNEVEKTEKLGKIVNEKNEKYPENILFKQENYLQEIKNGDVKYDVIFCLNFSKWIHLNFGDNAIKLLFLNVYNQLEENGYFIFQFQNWKSYKKKKNLTKQIYENYKEIKLKPERFEEYLEKSYNFKLIKKFTLPNNSKKMFERPLYIFQKKVYK